MRKFRNMVFIVGLGLASLTGWKMNPEQIEELMAAMNQPKIAHVLKEENDNGDELGKFKIRKR